MDSLTHIVLGAAVGEAILGKQVGKRAMLWGAVAASAPDIDAILSFFVSDIDSLILHRGITHSIFTALLIGPLWAWLVWKWNNHHGALKLWILLFTSNILLHDLLDTCTVYGTGLLSPFTDYRFSTDNIFVADPLYTLPLLISFLAMLFLKRHQKIRHSWNKVGLLLSSIYLVVTFVNHATAVKALKNSMNEKGIESESFFAAPTLFNNMLWNVVAGDSAGFWIGYYSIFDGDKSPELIYRPRNNELLTDSEHRDEIKKLRIFTKGYYCITEKDGVRWFNDLRFGQVGGWENPDANFAFAFDLSEDADNTMVVQKGRIEGSKRKMFASMWNRIKGN